MIIATLLILSIIESIFGPNIILSKFQNIPNPNELTKQSKLSFDMNDYQATAQLQPGSQPASASSKVALVYDLTGKRLIYAKATDESVPVASLTKLMTALVIMQEHKPDEIVTIPDTLPELSAQDQKINLAPNEQFELSELLNALLVHSANDAANALAIWDSGSIEEFSNKMNNYAAQWGLGGSNFLNPSGLDQQNHKSTGADLLTLATILLQNESFRKIINTQSRNIQSLNGKKYLLTTTNQSLSLPYVYGIKTGFTKEAGQSLMLLAEKEGHQIVTLVLNSSDRFTESNNMIKYTFDNYSWK